MKIPVALVVAALLLTGCKGRVIDITVTNATSSDRKGEIVEIPFDKITDVLKEESPQHIIVTDDKGTEVRSQVVYEGNTMPVKVIFMADVAASSESYYHIKSGTKILSDTLAYGRFVPERLDDYAWENDRIAFRIYGPALIEKDGPSNGLDVWVKRTSEMVVNSWYGSYLKGLNSYHDDNGQGCDCFKVGRTLGAGAMAPYINDSLWLGINFLTYRTLDNGPLRTSFELTYPPFTADAATVCEKRTITLDAGSQLTMITEEYSGIDHPFNVAAGIVLRPEGTTLACSADKGYMTYSLDVGDNGITYLGTIIPYPVSEITEHSGHLLMETDYAPGMKLTYYTGAGWSKWGFENSGEWISYIESYAERILNPLKISYN